MLGYLNNKVTTLQKQINFGSETSSVADGITRFNLVLQGHMTFTLVGCRICLWVFFTFKIASTTEICTLRHVWR